MTYPVQDPRSLLVKPHQILVNHLHFRSVSQLSAWRTWPMAWVLGELKDGKHFFFGGTSFWIILNHFESFCFHLFFRFLGIQIMKMWLPSGNLTKLWKITILNAKVHYKWSFSITILSYQRVKNVQDPEHRQTRNILMAGTARFQLAFIALPNMLGTRTVWSLTKLFPPKQTNGTVMESWNFIRDFPANPVWLAVFVMIHFQ